MLCFQDTVIKSNQIIFIGLRSSQDYCKRPVGDVGIWEGSLVCEFLRGSMCAEGMGCGRRWVYLGTSGNRDCQWASRSALKDFTDDALFI